MGCLEVTDLSALTAEKINETIDKFFAGLKIRKTNINDIINIVKQKVLTRNISESKDILTELQNELTNNEFANESKQIITKARKVSKEEYNDDTLVYQSLFFLANGDVDTFTKAYKTVNIAQKGANVASQVNNVKNDLFGGNILGGIKSGINAIKNTANLGEQVVNPNQMPREDLKKFLNFHINFISLLPVDILKTHTESNKITQTINYVLTNAFGKQPQEKYINDMFEDYKEDKVNVDDFFKTNYNAIKDDKTLRLGLVKKFIGGMTPRQLIAAARNFTSN